ncbi:MAG TPA: 1,3-beta-glucanase, partial [Thermoanaerobaculia bacterium]
MPEMDRRRMMLTTGIGLFAAAITVPEIRANASPLDAPPPAAPPPNGQYIFQDEFDGPAGSAPDPAKWEVALAR